MFGDMSIMYRILTTIVLLMLAFANNADAAIITFKGFATDLEGKNLPVASFATLRATLIDDSGNLYQIPKIGTQGNQYSFTFDTDNVAALKQKGLRLTISADARQDAVLARVLGTTPDGKDTIYTVNVTLPEIEPNCCIASPVRQCHCRCRGRCRR